LISVARQCELLDLCRASYYYRPVAVSAEELRLLRRLDEQYTKTPFYGVRRMTAVLRQEGVAVNPKRVRRLLRTLGLWALDNVFVERLWRSVKYEEVYLHDYEGMRDAHRGLGRYFPFYNEERPHQAMGYRTPLAVYGCR